MKLLLSTLASGNKGERLMVADVKRAYLHAKSKRLTYVQLPPEDTLPGEEHMCGKLNFSMHGTRDAAATWSEEYTEKLRAMGFSIEKASRCEFHHKPRGLRAYVHGDDFVVVGMPEQLKWMRSAIDEKSELTVEVLVPGKDQVKEARVLNMIIRWTKGGVEYEADPRHVEIILQQFNIGECKLAITPGTKDECQATAGDAARMGADEKLDGSKHVSYRAIVAIANYLAPGRPDIAFAVKEFARSMSGPCCGDWERPKRLARYLKGRPRVVKKFAWQRHVGPLTIYTDADWVGDMKTRKSTPGGCTMIGGHLLKAWSKTETLVALSSGESELYATLRAALGGLGMQSVAKDLGIDLRGEVWGDASAAIGMINRRGLGKRRHIDSGFLWT